MGSFHTRKLSFFLYCVFFFFFLFLSEIGDQKHFEQEEVCSSLPTGDLQPFTAPQAQGSWLPGKAIYLPRGTREGGPEEDPTHSQIAETQPRIGTSFLVSSLGGDTVILEGRPSGDRQRRMEDGG